MGETKSCGSVRRWTDGAPGRPRSEAGWSAPRQGGSCGRRGGQPRLLEPRLNDEEGLLERLLPVVERLEALEDAEEPLRELRVHHHGGGALDAGLQSCRWCHQRGRRRRKERLRRCRQGWLRGRLIGGVDGSGLRIAGHP
jgi:hypothetical protein